MPNRGDSSAYRLSKKVSSVADVQAEARKLVEDLDEEK